MSVRFGATLPTTCKSMQTTCRGQSLRRGHFQTDTQIRDLPALLLNLIPAMTKMFWANGCPLSSLLMTIALAEGNTVVALLMTSPAVPLGGMGGSSGDCETNALYAFQKTT